VDFICTLDSHVYNTSYRIAGEEKIGVHFVVSAAHSLAAMQVLTMEDLLSQDFLLTEHGMSYRRLLDEHLARHSLEIRPVLELGRPDIITHVLAQGIGVSFLPDFVTEAQVAAGKLCYLHVPDVAESVWKQLIYHKNKWVTAAMRAVIDYIKEKEFGI
jgi:DNA-binding transcriptional LysR family regulator